MDQLELYNCWLYTYFRILVGQFEAHMPPPHRRRQSSNYLTGPADCQYFAICCLQKLVRSFISLVKQHSALRGTDNELVNHRGRCCCGRQDICSAQLSWLDDLFVRDGKIWRKKSTSVRKTKWYESYSHSVWNYNRTTEGKPSVTMEWKSYTQQTRTGNTTIVQGK